MDKNEKMILLNRWMTLLGIRYVMIYSIDQNKYMTFDFLDDAKYSRAIFCYGDRSTLVVFSHTNKDKQKWNSYLSISDPYALSFIVDCLDDRLSWQVENKIGFLNSMFTSNRVAINIKDFSWETMAINLDIYDM